MAGVVMQRSMAAALLVCSGCKDKPADTASAAGSSVVAGSGNAAATAGSASAAATAGSGSAATPLDASAPDPRCAEACLFLVDQPVAQAQATFATACGTAWPYAATNCDALLYARNCIYAAHGNVFKKPEWKAKFENLPWYKPRPDFKESDLSALAMANIKELKRAYEQCDVPDVTAEDKKLIEQLLQQVSETNDSMLEIDGAIVRRASDRLRHHVIVDETSLNYAKKPTSDRRTIVVSGLYHAVGPGKLDDQLVVHFTFDASNALKAVEIE